MPSSARLPTDPDVDLHVARQRDELPQAPWTVLGAIAAGGALGALGRYGLAAAWPHAPAHFPWATFVTNVSGCLLIGILMVLITEVRRAHRLVRPFLGVGVLGGYTTFSTFSLDSALLIERGAWASAAAYMAGSAILSVVALFAGLWIVRVI